MEGNPNPVLAETAARLSPPGHAPDPGCGEGGDTVWLATHGWHVTAVDIARFTAARPATPEREATGPDGQTATVTDTVVTVRRT